jgi:hypothetical protein
MDLHSVLCWDDVVMESRLNASPDALLCGADGAASDSDRENAPCSALPPTIFVRDDSSPAPFSSGFPSFAGIFSQVGPLSYLVSTVLMCVAVLVAWQSKVADRLEPASQNRFTASRESVPSSVGCVTAMDGCQWTDEWTDEFTARQTRRTSPQPDLAIASPVSLGRKVRLDAGLLEITFDSGASVIVQGPAAFDVGSNGGFLHRGRLTGKLERPSPDSNGQSPAANPFAIRTPTATITDLGTEFGVEVGPRGRTTSCVFRGAVLVSASGRDGGQEDMVLKEDEAATVSASGWSGAVKINRENPDLRRFARQVPHVSKAMKVFGTGVATDERGNDRHWQLVARSDDPTFQPQDAIVVIVRRSKWGDLPPMASKIEKWISMSKVWHSPLTPGATCTFRTSFDLESGAAKGFLLRGAYSADKCVRAIRLNGRDVLFAEREAKYEWEKYGISDPGSFSIDNGFVEGTNLLEIDVEADDAPDSFPEMEAIGMKSALGLRVALEASWQTPAQIEETVD